MVGAKHSEGLAYPLEERQSLLAYKYERGWMIERAVKSLPMCISAVNCWRRPRQ